MKTLYDIAEQFHNHRRSLRFSLYTESRLRPMLKLFLDYLKKNFSVETASEIRSSHLRAYQTHLSSLVNRGGLPLRPGSVNNRIKAVKAFARFMETESLVLTGTSEHISYVKEPELLPTSVLTHAQARQVIGRIGTSSTAECRDRTMLELLYSTGVRNAELVSLTLDRINFDSGTMRVLGKGNKERAVPIGKTALKHLTSYVRAVRPFIPGSAGKREIFLNSDGSHLKGYTLRKIVHASAEKAGFDRNITPHTFRRSCATELIRGGANIYHVKELLGHESLDTLKHYTKLTINDLKKTHERCHPREKDSS